MDPKYESGSVSVLSIRNEYLYSYPDSGSKHCIRIRVMYLDFVLGLCTWILILILYPDSIFEFGKKKFLFFSASGLMIASRYPILAVDFHVCRHKRSLWQKPICYGIIMAKVELFGGKVGFLANLHNVAYQGTVFENH